MKLRPLQDLSNFSMDGNPMSSLEHSQLFVIFQLRSLNCLDGKKISVEERQMADKRFAQGIGFLTQSRRQCCFYMIVLCLV